MFKDSNYDYIAYCCVPVYTEHISMEVEGVSFSSEVAPLGSTKQLILGGAGIPRLLKKLLLHCFFQLHSLDDCMPYAVITLSYKSPTSQSMTIDSMI